MNSVARKILLLIAVPVFLFSSVMVLKYRCEMQESIKYTDSIAQLAVSFSEKPAVTAVPNFPDEEAARVEATQTPENDSEEVYDICPVQVDFDALCKKK